MRHLAICCCAAALVAGCAKSRDKAADTAVAVTAVPGAPAAATSLAKSAGTWTGRSMPMDKDSVLSTWVLVTTPDTGGWVLTFPNGKPIPVRVVAVQGDSVVTEMGPFASASRRGEMVNVRAVDRMKDGKRVGTYEMRPVSKPDSVIRGRFEATRAP